MKGKLIVLTGIGAFIVMVCFVLFGGISGGGGEPAPIPIEEDYCYNYQYTAYKLGVDWEMALILDMFNAQEYKRPITEENYLITTLNFVKLKEDVYREESDHDEESGTTTTSYVYEGTNYYTGAAEILSLLGISDKEKNVDKLLSALESRKSQTHRYTLEREMDNQLVLDTYYSYFTDSQKKAMRTAILQSHMTWI